jgi:DMSO/TMAO reductase YedYZ molybdopterin-dependent catalytic subunit
MRRDLSRGNGLLSRRSLLARLATMAPFAAAGPLIPSWASRVLAQAPAGKERLIIRAARPQDLETPVGLLDTWITPNDRFFVRSHLYTPEVDRNQWRLTVGGEVARPASLTFDDLRQLPQVTIAATLECAGNGRANFTPPVAGVQWQKGAVGTARWTGVRLADVLGRAGVNVAGRFVLLDGADVPLGRMPDFVRQIPIAKAMDPSTLIALEMNGSPIPVPNGYPARAIVPGWEGAYSMKWLTGVRVLAEEHDNFWIKTAYRYPTRPVAPGAAVPPEQMAPVTGLAVKSLITSPADGATAAGVVSIRGVAWAGEANIATVDVSTDGGSTWAAARLGDDHARYCWRQFTYEWRPAAPGAYLVMSRATDDTGRVQPIVPQWNPSGYLWNAIDQVRVNVDAI